jgi:hypothetical protein
MSSPTVGNSSNKSQDVSTSTYRLSRIIKPKEKDFGILVHQPYRLHVLLMRSFLHVLSRQRTELCKNIEEPIENEHGCKLESKLPERGVEREKKKHKENVQDTWTEFEVVSEHPEVTCFLHVTGTTILKLELDLQCTPPATEVTTRVFNISLSMERLLEHQTPAIERLHNDQAYIRTAYTAAR